LPANQAVELFAGKPAPTAVFRFKVKFIKSVARQSQDVYLHRLGIAALRSQ